MFFQVTKYFFAYFKAKLVQYPSSSPTYNKRKWLVYETFFYLPDPKMEGWK